MYSKDIRHQEVTSKKATEETTRSAWTKTSVIPKKNSIFRNKMGVQVRTAFEPEPRLGSGSGE